MARLSRTVTSAPSSRSASTRWEPTKPAPPVTRERTSSGYGTVPRAHGTARPGFGPACQSFGPACQRFRHSAPGLPCRPVTPPVRVLRVIARMNVGGPARIVADLMDDLDPTRFEQRLLTGSSRSRRGRRARAAPEVVRGHSHRRAGSGAEPPRRPPGPAASDLGDPHIPPAHRRDAHGQGRRHRTDRRVHRACARDRARLPRPSPARILLAVDDERRRRHRAPPRASHDAPRHCRPSSARRARRRPHRASRSVRSDDAGCRPHVRPRPRRRRGDELGLPPTASSSRSSAAWPT